jgi:hypothetical protein
MVRKPLSEIVFRTDGKDTPSVSLKVLEHAEKSNLDNVRSAMPPPQTVVHLFVDDFEQVITMDLQQSAEKLIAIR